MCLTFYILVAQNQNRDAAAVAAVQLEDADTVKKVESFLVSQRDKLVSEMNKFSEIIQKTDEKSRDKKIRELLPVRQKLIAKVLNENIQAGEKILAIAKDQDERAIGYNCLIDNYSSLAQSTFLDICLQKIDEAGIKDDDPDFQKKAMKIAEKLRAEEIVSEPQKKLDALVDQMDKEGKYEELVKNYRGMQLMQGLDKLEAKFSLEKFAKLKDDVKKWTKGVVDDTAERLFNDLLTAASSPAAVAVDKQIAEKTLKEITDYIGSDEYTKDVELRNQLLKHLKGVAARLVGADLNLYGQTINNETFDWNSLRGKIVLVKFTASWCGPCKMEIPGMRQAYEKYRSKGLEIVSVYVFEDGNSETKAVDDVKKVVAEEKISWIILSEALTKKKGGVPQAEKYSVQGVPTMLLVGKDGKVIATETRGEVLEEKLAELFDK
jgi:thiol-disulfide isomerase/thioredoxin